MKINKSIMVPVDYEFLKTRIREKGLTLSGVAAELGWSSSYLSREKIENRGGVKPRDLQYLAQLLECDEEAIMAPVPAEPVEMPKEGKPTTAASLTDEELIQELMKRLLSRR